MALSMGPKLGGSNAVVGVQYLGTGSCLVEFIA